MKRFLSVAVLLSVTLCASAETREVNDDGTTVIDTRNLTKKVYGHGGVTPIKLHLDSGVVCGVEMLPNSESPAYFREVREKFTHYWTGMTLQEVVECKVDVISGASCSSEAIIENVKTAAQYELNQPK